MKTTGKIVGFIWRGILSGPETARVNRLFDTRRRFCSETGLPDENGKAAHGLGRRSRFQ
jgi:hypothetical protein